MRILPVIAFVATVAFLGVGCGNSNPNPPAGSNAPAMPKTNASSSLDNPLNAPAGYLGGLAKSKALAEKTADSASLNQAVQLFYAQEGRYPKDLQELVTQKYLPYIPAAPYGMKLTYDAASGKVAVTPAQ